MKHHNRLDILRAMLSGKSKKVLIEKIDDEKFEKLGYKFLKRGEGFWVFEELKENTEGKRRIIKVEILDGNERDRDFKIVFYLHKILEEIFPEYFAEIESMILTYPKVVFQTKVDGEKAVAIQREVINECINNLGINAYIDQNPDNFITENKTNRIVNVDFVVNNFIRSIRDVDNLITSLSQDWFQPRDSKQHVLEQIRLYAERILQLRNNNEMADVGTLMENG